MNLWPPFMNLSKTFDNSAYIPVRRQAHMEFMQSKTLMRPWSAWTAMVATLEASCIRVRIADRRGEIETVDKPLLSGIPVDVMNATTWGSELEIEPCLYSWGYGSLYGPQYHEWRIIDQYPYRIHQRGGICISKSKRKDRQWYWNCRWERINYNI